MTGIVLAMSGGVASVAVPLSAIIGDGESASDWNNDAWTFNPITCTASGGTGPYTYAWTYSSSSGGSWGFAGSSTLATVAPQVTGVANVASAVLICTVTDAASAVKASNDATYDYEQVF
jgi:hypothetical protein